MGALDIRQSSAQLKSLGQFRMPELDNGSARAWEAHARAAQAAANAAATAGRAAIEGISRRGQIVANTLNNLGKMAIDLFNRENERIATNAVLASEKERNAFMYGDGTADNPGQFNIEFDAQGAEAWLRSLRDEKEKRDAKYTEKLNAPQRRIYEERMAQKEADWQLRIGAHAAKKTFQYEVTTAVADTKAALDEACAKFSDPNRRDAAIADYYGKVESEFGTRGLPESQRSAFFRMATEKLLAEMPKYTFDKWVSATAESDDPKFVREEWNRNRELLTQTDGRAPLNDLIRKHLGSDSLADDQVKFIKAHFEESADKAIRRAENLRTAHIKAVSQKYDDEVAGKRSDLMDPAKTDTVEFDIADFRRRLDREPLLDATAKAAILGDYRSAMDYQSKYRTDQAAFAAAQDKLRKAQSEHDRKAAEAARLEMRQRGYWDRDGNFQPASVFIDAKDVTMQTYDDFSDDQPFWNGDKRKARARLEAAKMTGRLSRTFYENRLSFLRAKTKEGFDKRWQQIYPLISDLEKSGYGKQKLTKAEAAYRNTQMMPEAIWAKSKNSNPKHNGTADTFRADSFFYDGDGPTGYDTSTEEFIDLATMQRVYDVCADLEASGVELKEAVRQIIAPSLSEAFGKSILERIDDQDFLNAIKRNYDETTHFDTDVRQAVTSELIKQGRNRYRGPDIDTREADSKSGTQIGA